jgi:Protein of unknown function (DUF2442)
MIKIVSARLLRDYVIAIGFSDGAGGEFDLAPLIAKQSTLTQALTDPAYFKEFFLELGALCWRNGFELSPGAIYRDLEAQGKLVKHFQAA